MRSFAKWSRAVAPLFSNTRDGEWVKSHLVRPFDEVLISSASVSGLVVVFIELGSGLEDIGDSSIVVFFKWSENVTSSPSLALKKK